MMVALRQPVITVFDGFLGNQFIFEVIVGGWYMRLRDQAFELLLSNAKSAKSSFLTFCVISHTIKIPLGHVSSHFLLNECTFCVSKQKFSRHSVLYIRCRQLLKLFDFFLSISCKNAMPEHRAATLRQKLLRVGCKWMSRPVMKNGFSQTPRYLLTIGHCSSTRLTRFLWYKNTIGHFICHFEFSASSKI